MNFNKVVSEYVLGNISHKAIWVEVLNDDIEYIIIDGHELIILYYENYRFEKIFTMSQEDLYDCLKEKGIIT